MKKDKEKNVTMMQNTIYNQLSMKFSLPLFLFLCLLTAGCAVVTPFVPTPTRIPTTAARTITPVPTTNTATATLIPDTTTPTHTHTVTFTPTNGSFPIPTDIPGCQKPSDDYSRIDLEYATLNTRTYTMLQHAAERYEGEIDILSAITQGSYTDAVEASFGTHAGGGAVDISVLRAGTYTILWDEIEPLIRALRSAGFAAWLRDLDALYPGSPIHIHAIAIGDQELSYSAQLQVYGSFGYFAGMDGLPPPAGQEPNPDPHGGPVVCEWMREMGLDQ